MAFKSSNIFRSPAIVYAHKNSGRYPPATKRHRPKFTDTPMYIENNVPPLPTHTHILCREIKGSGGKENTLN